MIYKCEICNIDFPDDDNLLLPKLCYGCWSKYVKPFVEKIKREIYFINTKNGITINNDPINDIIDLAERYGEK